MQSLSPKRDPLLEPFLLGRLQLRNRIVSTSHASMLDDGGMPGERYQAYHEEKAKGGIALTMIGGSAMVSKDSDWGGGQLDFSDDRILPYLAKLTARVHSHGAALMGQISHLGRRANALYGHYLPALGPSPRREGRSRSIPRELDRQDIDRIIRDYVAAALRARDGGLDGIETLTGGHLIGQFLSPLANRRSDGFGGSLENRARFGLMVHEAIRAALGPDYPVGLRLVVDETSEGGLSAQDCIEIGQMFERAGTVDFFDCIYGRMGSDWLLSEHNMPGMFQPDAPYLEAVRNFRAQISLPLIHAGGIRDVATARHAVSSGIVDLVGMTRAHIADPHLVRKLMEGAEDRIRPCVGATYCTFRKATCIHNPSTAHEAELPHEIAPADQPRRVVVVGGGVAGLEAARVAALRGHRVLLLEAAPRLGGQLLLAARAPFRASLLGIVDWRIAELAHLGVEVRTGVLAEAEHITAEGPDAVFIATGGIPPLDGFPGAELCASTWDLLGGTVRLATEVLVHDATGRQAAPSCALLLAAAGTRVRFSTPDGQVAVEMSYQDGTGFRSQFAKMGIAKHTERNLCSVRREGGRLAAVLADTYTGTEETILIDQVVIEQGTLPVSSLFEALRPLSCNDGLDEAGGLLSAAGLPANRPGFGLWRLGDAVASRDAHSAIRDALRLARVV